MADFNDKLKNLNEKVTSNKTKYVEAEKKIQIYRIKLHKYHKKDITLC